MKLGTSTNMGPYPLKKAVVSKLTSEISKNISMLVRRQIFSSLKLN